jgi:predicted Fe-Mo cluster-binding NifX family protein
MIAVSINDDQTTISRIFARCSWFALYTAGQNEAVVWIENTFKNELEDAGTKVVHYLHDKGATLLISGDFGTKVQQLAADKKIKLAILPANISTLQQLMSYHKNKK